MPTTRHHLLLVEPYDLMDVEAVALEAAVAGPQAQQSPHRLLPLGHSVAQAHPFPGPLGIGRGPQVILRRLPTTSAAQGRSAVRSQLD